MTQNESVSRQHTMAVGTATILLPAAGFGFSSPVTHFLQRGRSPASLLTLQISALPQL